MHRSSNIAMEPIGLTKMTNTRIIQHMSKEITLEKVVQDACKSGDSNVRES